MVGFYAFGLLLVLVLRLTFFFHLGYPSEPHEAAGMNGKMVRLEVSNGKYKSFQPAARVVTERPLQHSHLSDDFAQAINTLFRLWSRTAAPKLETSTVISSTFMGQSSLSAQFRRARNPSRFRNLTVLTQELFKAAGRSPSEPPYSDCDSRKVDSRLTRYHDADSFSV